MKCPHCGGVEFHFNELLSLICDKCNLVVKKSKAEISDGEEVFPSPSLNLDERLPL